MDGKSVTYRFTLMYIQLYTYVVLLFNRWFKQRPEQEVLVSSHSAFMWHFFNHAHPGYCEEEGFDPEMCRDMVPVVEYDSGDKAFEEFMRSRWANCELRSMVVVYKINE